MLLVASAHAFDLADLAAARGRIVISAARFRETRHIATLLTPLERSGTLLYRRPDHIAMHVVTPQPEDLVIDGNTLRLSAPAGERTLALDDEPALLAWTESLRATLAGDVPALTRYFVPTLSGDSSGWRLALEPRDAALRAQISSIVIDGEADALRRVEVRESGGDDTVMDITPLPASAQ